jgi:hypothetical protein
MGANLPHLPDELLLSIASNVPSLQEFSLVSKQLCRIGACVAVQRTRDDPSHMIISEAIQTLRWLNTWAQTQNLIEKLCTNVQNRFVRDVHGRKMNDALDTLRLLDLLPQNAVIPEYDFLVIMDTVSRWVFMNLNIGLRDWFFPITALVLLSRLSSPARIPQEQFFDLIRTIQGQIIQDIENGRHHFSSIMLRDLSSLTWGIEMPDDFFFDILETNRNSAIYFINNGQLEDAKATLQVLRHFPVDIRIPPNFFFAVVETIRDRLERTINDDLHSSMKLLWILDALPSTTRVPNEYFIHVVTHLWSLLPSAIKNGVGHDATKILLLLHRLPASTTLLKDEFPRLEETIRSQITRDMSFGRVRRATRMAEVLRILSGIEEYCVDTTE